MNGCSDSDIYSLYGQGMQQTGGMSLLDLECTISSVDSIVPAGLQTHVNQTIKSSGAESSQTELEFLSSCRDAGVVHIMGNTVVRARRESGICNKIAIDYVYAFLRKICRDNSVIFNLPHESLLSVGQIFFV